MIGEFHIFTVHKKFKVNTESEIVLIMISLPHVLKLQPKGRKKRNELKAGDNLRSLKHK